MGLLQVLKLLFHALTETNHIVLAQKFIHAGLDLLRHHQGVTADKADHYDMLADRVINKMNRLNAHAKNLDRIVNATHLPVELAQKVEK